MAGRIERGIRRRVFRRATRPTADREPPPCPEGWRAGPPDFVGVGVQRAGTSWWFRELREHPDFARPPDAPKELHFFDAFSNRRLSDADITRYHGWFPRPAGGITGEWTPVYIYEPWAVPMVLQAAPDARVLLLLRDPIDRFYSGYRFGIGRGYSPGEATLEAYNRGLYTMQVKRLLAHVPRPQLLVLLYEDLRADPAAARRRTAEFVGLDPDRFTRSVNAREPTTAAEATRRARARSAGRAAAPLPRRSRRAAGPPPRARLRELADARLGLTRRERGWGAILADLLPCAALGLAQAA